MVHSTLVLLLIGNALIVSTDDNTSTDVLLVITDISLYCLMVSLSECPSTVQIKAFPVPLQVMSASV